MDLSLVVPSFKQAPTIRRDLRKLTHVLDALHMSYELVVVVDGNIDNTVEIIQSAKDLRHVRVETLEHNSGKGFALKHGLSKTTGAIAGFIDAGGDIDCDCLRIMIDLMQFSRADIVIGSKRHPLSVIKYPLVRRIYSFAYQLINRLLFNLDVRDTQVGVKLFRQEVIATVLPHIQINRFAFDLELLVLARLFQYGNIVESPVKIQHAFRSTINIFSVLETLLDTIRLYFRERNFEKIRPTSGISVSIFSVGQPQKKQEYTREIVQ